MKQTNSCAQKINSLWGGGGNDKNEGNRKEGKTKMRGGKKKKKQTKKWRYNTKFSLQRGPF